MVQLTAPIAAVHRSYLEAVEEYRVSLADGKDHQPREYSYIESRFMDGDPSWLDDQANFGLFVDRIRADALSDFPRPEGWCPATHLWLVEGDEYLGAIDIRHELTEFLRNVGGTIGYDIRPSARGRGLGSLMLKLALPYAKQLGFAPALITCDTTNAASIAVIKSNGGILEDERNRKLRYWVPTS